ncbi:MAG: glycosyltransferase family 2 protein [Cytophagales bacterium]|nr:MAG: glycosyltransferase family 2 protein [Cytophagales bacterium]
MPLYSVIIRAHNEEKFIGKLFESLFEQTIIEQTEVILVDSGSKDRTIEIAKSFPVKIIHIQPHDFTFGRALNKGILAASGEIMIFASAHVYPTNKHWLENLVKPFSNEKIALSYGRQVGNEITKYSEHQIFKKWFPAESHFVQKHPFCNNANCAIRKSLWESQTYDEDITGLEDLAWANKILQKGYWISYVAEAAIVHIHEETPKKIRNRYKREAIAYKNIFPEAHFSLADFVLLFISNTFSDYIHAVREGKFWENLLDIPMFRFMQFWGTYQGYRHQGTITEILKRRFYYPNSIR